MRTPKESHALVDAALQDMTDRGILVGFNSKEVAQHVVKCHVHSGKQHSIFTHAVLNGSDATEKDAVRSAVRRLFANIEYVRGA